MIYHTVVIIFLTVAIFRPPLNLLCRTVMGYSLISLQLKLYGRHLHTNSPTKCSILSSCPPHYLSIFLSANLYCHDLFHLQPYLHQDRSTQYPSETIFSSVLQPASLSELIYFHLPAVMLSPLRQLALFRFFTTQMPYPIHPLRNPGTHPAAAPAAVLL